MAKQSVFAAILKRDGLLFTELAENGAVFWQFSSGCNDRRTCVKDSLY